MTCKDCIHHDLCFDNGTLFIRFTAIGRKAENVETNCPFKNFKNKADFVEVVRCKDCKYWTTENDGCCTNLRALVLVENENKDFCCRGVRRGAEGGN